MWGSTLASSIPVIGKFTDVRVESSTDTSLSFSYGFIGNFLRFRVHYRKVGETGEYSRTNYTTAETGTINNLVSGDSYDILIKAEYGSQSVSSDIITATTNVINPSPATNLFATSITDNSFTINWTIGANTDRVRVRHRKVGDTSFITSVYITDVNNVNTYGITGLTSGDEYEVFISSENNGIAVNSEIKLVTTIVLEPSPVTNLFANNITENSALINWTIGANTNRVRVYHSEDNITFLASNYITDVNNVNTKLLNNLKQNQKYYVYVKSENQGNVATSATINFTTITLQPSKATGLFANDITDTSFRANWDIGANTNRVQLYYSEDNITFISGSYITDTQNTNSYVVSGVKTGTLYYFKVRSENAGKIVYSDTKTVTTTTTNVLPSPARNLNVTGVTETSMILNWTVGDNTDRLRVEWSKDNSTWVLGNFITNLSVNSYTITPLEDGTKYYLRIRSEKSGEVIYSSAITETTLIDKTISTENLLSYYPLDETSGNALDKIGSDTPLALFGAITRNGSFYSFNGVDSYLQDINDGTIKKHIFVDNGNDTPFTIRMSVRFDNFSQAWLFCRRHNSDTGEYTIAVIDGILYITLFEKDNRYKTVSKGFNISGLSTSKFYRLGFRYLGNKLRSSLAIFLDGNRVDNINSGSSSYAGMKSTLADTTIGAPQFNHSFKFSGDIRKIHIDKGGYLSDNEMMWDFEQNL